MLSTLVFESLSLWPLAAALVIVSTAALVWFYPPQLRGAGWSKWFVPALRWVGVGAVGMSLLKPVFVEPKSDEQWGAVAVLVDCSRSMSVVDRGRTVDEKVALAGALGLLPAGVRSDTVATLGVDIERLESRLRDVLKAQSDLEYARLSGRGIREKDQQVARSIERYSEAARAVAARPASVPAGSDLAAKLKDMDSVPTAEAREAWSDDVRRKIDRLRSAAKAFQAAADEQLYKSNTSVRQTCEKLARLSRLELAEKAVLEPQTGLISRLGPRVPVIGFAIDGKLSSIALTENGRPSSSVKLEARATRSDLVGALAAAVNSLSKRPIRAVVLLSDGRQVGGRGDVTSSLHPSGAPVFTVETAAARTPDLSITSVSLPASAFAGEVVEGDAVISDAGGVRAPTELHVQSSSGEQVETLTPRARRDRREQAREWGASFAVPINPREARYAERIVLILPPAPIEATSENNRIERWLKVSSDRLKVALCTGAPTWDFQYLRAAMARRQWVQLDAHLLNPDRPKLSMTPQEILQQDVFVLDDVPVGALDVNQWDAVRQLLTVRGGSVILIAGTSFPVSDYAHQPIAKTLLPFRDVQPSWKQWPGEQPAFHFVPTPLAERGPLRLGNTPEATRRRWQDLPGVYQYLQIPEGSLLADAQPLLVEADGHSPVLTERRLGAGRVLFLGLNETWRWRFKSGEPDADQFWRQLVRHAAGEPYAASQGPLSLDVDKVAAQPGEPIRVRARLRSSKTPLPSAPACPVLILKDGKTLATRQLAAVGAGHFAGLMSDLPAGEYQLELRGTAANGEAQSVQVPLHIAESAEAEMSDVSGDPAMLDRIARSSGGQFLTIDQLDRLPERLNALHETESRFVRRPVWNSPLFFGFVLACFTGEWALRKRFGLA